MEINDNAEVQACGLKLSTPSEPTDEQKRQMLIDRLADKCDTSRHRLEELTLGTLRQLAKYNLSEDQRL